MTTDLINREEVKQNPPHKFIQIPPDLVKQLGKHLYLDLEKHYGENSILLITIPNCPKCADLVAKLHHAQMISKRNNQTFLIYYMTFSASDICSEALHRDMGISNFPALYAVDRKGKMTSWVPRFLSPSESDPFGIGRVTSSHILESLDLRII